MAVFPTLNLTYSVGIPTANQMVLRREALDVLEQSLHHLEAAMPDAYEQQTGRTAIFYRPENFAAAGLAPDSEDDLKTGLTYSENIIAFSLAQFKDWVSVSQFLKDTSPTPVLKNAADRLSYRARLRFDSMMRAVYDSEAINMTLAPLTGTTLIVNDLRNARTQMRMASVKPQPNFDNRFPSYCAPVVTFDLVRDPAAGGLLDIQKRQSGKDNALWRYTMDDDLSDIAGCRIIETTNVKITTGTPNLYRNYIHGYGGFVKSTLRTKWTEDPLTRRFSCYMGEGGPSQSNPTGDLGGWASYRAYFVAGCVAGNPGIGDVPRSRIIDSQSSVG